MSTEQLTPTSYLVLGLLAREGPSTPYGLERLVAATLGNFWSFPHTLLYSEPARLASLGLVTEARETDGRRRRMFAVTSAGLEALAAWLGRPVHASTELRDLGLLQLFFMDLASDESRLRLAEAQLEVHGAKLSEYEEDARIEVAGVARDGRPLLAGRRTVEHWRGATLPAGSCMSVRLSNSGAMSRRGRPGVTVPESRTARVLSGRAVDASQPRGCPRDEGHGLAEASRLNARRVGHRRRSDQRSCTSGSQPLG
jgi:DNA-binding PadR family transcriptional regulator